MKVIAIDLETTGLHHQNDRIRLISYFSDTESGTTESVADVARWLSDSSIVKVFHNALFDVSFLQSAGFETLNYIDTMIMAQVLEGNAADSYTLAALAKRYLNVKLDKQLQHSDHWNDELTEEHHQYALRDAQITFELCTVLQTLLNERELQGVNRREQGALPIVQEVAKNGLRLDVAGWTGELQKVSVELNQLENLVRHQLKDSTLNLHSHQQLKMALHKVGVMVDDVQEATIRQVVHRHEALSNVLKWKKLKKIQTTFGDKLLNQVTIDQKIHGRWFSIGTATGRMSCRSLALQALPRRIRPYVQAREGHVLVLADYSAIELRVLAYVSADEALSNVFHEGKDPHRMTAASLFDVKEEDVTEEQRNVAKVVNFGIVYGMTSHGLQQRLSTTLERDVLFEEAEQYRQRYFQTYPGVLDYQKRMLTASVISTAGGREYGLHVPPLPPGSVKRFNYPIQSAAADGLKEALCLWHKEKLPSYQTIHLIHDEVILEVREEEADEAARLLKEVMVRGMRHIIPTIPMEVEIGHSWS